VRRQLTIAAFTAFACAALLGAIILGGKISRDSLQSSERFQMPFDQIECPAPPGMDRTAFLDEIRYYGEFPKTVSILDESLRDKLGAAFAQHPWVEKVDAIEVAPGKQLKAELTFRTPILAVQYYGPGPITRVVDGSGVVLPIAASAQSLPRLTGKDIPSPAAAGQIWGNAQVEGAAHVAALLHPHQSTLKLTQFRWQNDQLHLQRDSSSATPDVIWGQASGSESNGEQLADVKLHRLLSKVDHLDNSSGSVIDLRKP
jgi:hypothetical protein